MDRPSSSLESRRAERALAEQKRAEKSSMKTRIWTGVVGLPLLIAIMYLGGFVLVIGVSALAFFGIIEYTRAINRMMQPKINRILMLALAAMLMITIKLDYYFLMPVLLVSFIVIFCYEILSGNVEIQRGSATLMGLIYVPVMFGHLFLFETVNKGAYYMWLIFVIAFTTDTAAYFIGKSIGNRKIAPLISPKKNDCRFGWRSNCCGLVHNPLRNHSQFLLQFCFTLVFIPGCWRFWKHCRTMRGFDSIDD